MFESLQNKIAEWAVQRLTIPQLKQIFGIGTPLPLAQFPILNRINEETSQSLTSVYSAINRISSDIAVMPLLVRQRMKDGSSRIATEHHAYDVLRTSWDTGKHTAFVSRRQSQAWTLGWGQSICEIEWTNGNRLQAIHTLHPRRTEAKLSETGELYYSIDNDQTKLPPSKVLHFMAYSLDGLNGASPLKLCKVAMALGLSQDNSALGVFSNGLNSRGFFKTPKALNAEQLKELRSSMDDTHGGPENTGKYGILHGGLDWIASSISPEDAQLIASRTFTVQEVARIYSIPPSKIGDLSRATFSNIEEQNSEYATMTLMTWLEMIESELELKILTPAERAAGYYIEHDLTNLLRGNLTARTAFYTAMADRGVLSANEIRAKEGLGPIVGGDAHLVQLNLQPLEKVGNTGTQP